MPLRSLKERERIEISHLVPEKFDWWLSKIKQFALETSGSDLDDHPERDLEILSKSDLVRFQIKHSPATVWARLILALMVSIWLYAWPITSVRFAVFRYLHGLCRLFESTSPICRTFLETWRTCRPLSTPVDWSSWLFGRAASVVWSESGGLSVANALSPTLIESLWTPSAESWAEAELEASPAITPLATGWTFEWSWQNVFGELIFAPAKQTRSLDLDASSFGKSNPLVYVVADRWVLKLKIFIEKTERSVQKFWEAFYTNLFVYLKTILPSYWKFSNGNIKLKQQTHAWIFQLETFKYW